jgi:hypothetical protein
LRVGNEQELIEQELSRIQIMKYIGINLKKLGYRRLVNIL